MPDYGRLLCTLTGVRGRVPIRSGRLLPPHFPKEATTITARRKPLPQATSRHQEHQLCRFIAACIGRLSDSSLHFTNARFLSRCHSRSRYLRRRPSGSPRPSDFIPPLHILGCRIRLSYKFCLGLRLYPQLSSDSVQSLAR